MGEKLVLLDGYSLMYRAFHALSTPMTAPDGTPTNAVHGFVMMLLRVLDEEAPTAAAVAFDVSKHTFRTDLYDGYKANRKPMPEELRQQDPVIRDLLGRMGLRIVECEGFEADDILGTLSRQCEEMGMEALLVTGDRDSFQLAGENTSILYTKRGISETQRVTPAWVRETYGVTPAQLIDVKGLMGDASDNIPGVPGVGEKTALRLVAQYGDLEHVLAGADKGEKGRLRERLLENADLARLSRTLATICRDAPVALDLDAWRLDGLGGGLARLRELGMNQAARRLAQLAGDSAPAPAPAAETAPASDGDVETPPDAAALAARLAQLAATANHVALHVGAAFSAATDAARLRMPLGGDLIDPGISAAEALEAARPLLAAKAPKALYDVKALGALLPETAGDAFDAMLAAYVLDPQRPSYDLQALCESAGTPWDAACPAASLWPLRLWQEEKLASDELTAIYRDIERPLAGVLYAMEREGFLIDADALEALGRDFRARAAELEAQIYALAGETFNIKSPKQLSEVLFDKLGLPRPRKTNRGFATTSAEVLESLSGDYPICALILDYRRYQKLDSTYVGALIKLRDENGRVHSSFDQTATATGRISSNEPNLQNIPVRTEVGREIRAAFVARPGWVLVDADYSQIELRVLAHMSGDETMRSAFLEGQDIHSRTAAEVYGVPLDEVTPAMRSSAKAVNFGIVYGISDFTLAKNISVTRAEARAFMERYFARYPGVKRFMEDCVQLGYARGYARTLLGRRRYLPELKSPSYNVRAFGERCAMNSPIQGTAADIIKLAMIRVFEALRAQKLRARLILQVHDELIVEAPEDEAERVRALLQECMEGVMRLSVPLRTDISVGRNWRECK